MPLASNQTRPTWPATPPEGLHSSSQLGEPPRDTTILAELAPVAVLQCTVQGQVIWANAAARQIFESYSTFPAQVMLSDLLPSFKLNEICGNSVQSNHFKFAVETTYTVTAARHRWTAERLPEGAGFVLYGQPQTYYDRHSHALDHLMAVSNDTSLSFAERIHLILQSAYEYFELDFGALCRFDEGGVFVEALANEHPFLFRGQRLAVNETYCGLHSDDLPLIAIHDCSEQPFGTPEAQERVALGAVLSMRLKVGDRVYGAVTFGHKTPRIRPFSDEEIRFLSLTALWLEDEFRQQAQLKELTAREQRYRTLYNKTPVMMFSIDCKGTIIEASSRFLQAMGYQRERVIGRSYLDFVRIDCLPENTQTHPARQLALDGCTEKWAALTFVACDERVIETELRAMRHAPSEGRSEILCVLSDVTARNIAERELASTNTRLQQANEGLQRFNMIASHDLQEPLRKIRAFGSLLKSELGHCLAGDSAYALNAMVNASRRLSDLVDDLLVLSRESNREYRKQPVALDTVFADIFLANGVGWEADPLPVVACDPVATGRIIENIASNARKYAHRDIGPHVTVTATRTGDSGYAIAFTDKGVGLHDIDPAELFEPFKRFCDDPEVPGTGVGLAICAAIAQGHGWTMRAEDVPETGARFIIQVPQRDIIVEPGHTPSVAPLHSDMDALEDEELERMAPYSAA
jgi:PAS domain S-box-containing protein